MKDNKQWDNVHRTLKAQTCYQDVDDVLNPTYVPQTTQDIELFAEKQKHMCSVLERILQTDEGKVIVRSHDADPDAQLIYSEFLQVMTKSTEAMMDSDVLNPTYVPQTTQDIELFAEKQKYMCSVLERILQTDKGKVIVRSHDADPDAQLIYSEFLQVMTKSTEAMMDSGVLLSYLTAAKVSDGAWRGTAKGFVLHWMEKLRLYHELILCPADRLSENTQRALLQTAVQGLDVLRQVQTQCDLQKTMHGTVITFA
jgi:hypothetical protein